MKISIDNLTRILWIALLIIIAMMALYLFRRWLLIPMFVALVLIAITLPLLIWARRTRGAKHKAASPAEAVLQDERKQARIDEALRQLSDEELLDLRERISTGEISEERLYHELLGNE